MNKYNKASDIGYLGYFKTIDKLSASSSGGAATAFSETIINQGGVVIGVSYSKDFYRAEFRIIDNIDDLKYLKGSKYFAVDKKVLINGNYISINETVANYLSKNISVLFIGLGCDVLGLLNYCKANKINVNKLYTIDLFCQGVTPQIVFEKFIKELERKYKAKVIDINLRYKPNNVWRRQYIKIVFGNGKQFVSPLFGNDFGYVFPRLKKIYCYNCVCKGDNHPSDISIGDPWLLSKQESGFNANGMSSIIVHSNKGNQLIDMVDQDDFYLKKINIESILNSGYYNLAKKVRNYDDLLKNIETIGLHNSVIKHYGKFKYFLFKKIKLQKFFPKFLRKFIVNIIKR